MNKGGIKTINTVGELKELLSHFDDNLFVNFGTKKEGFEINSFGSDGISLALMSDGLEKHGVDYDQNIVIKVEQGRVTEVYTDNLKADIIVADYDCDSCSDDGTPDNQKDIDFAEYIIKEYNLKNVY
jgi:hypothetical protein